MKVFMINPGMVNDYVYELCSELQKKNTSVFLFGSSDYELRRKCFKNFNYYNYFLNVERISSSRLKHFIKGLLYIVLHLYVLKSIIKERPDVIHIQWCRIPVVDSFFIGIYSRYCPIVFTLHNTTLNHGDKTSLLTNYALGYKNILKNVSAIIVHTQYSQDKFIKDFPQFSSKVIVIPHGLLQFPHIDKSKKFDFNLDSKVVLLFFGNIQRYKGLDILIEAMRYLKNEDIKLLIAGKANINIDELKKRAEFLDISNKIVWHSEFIPDEDVQEIYDYCDIVILPHRHIDQSGVLMSAINFSKPVVASDTGGFSEIIKNGTHGYLFTPGDAFELSNKIKRILDDNSLRNMTKNIDRLKRSWKTWNEIAKITSSIYLNILNQNGKKET